MKQLFLSLCLACLSTAANAQNQAKSPVEYSTMLFNEHAAVVNRNMEYLQYSVHSDDIALVEQKRMGLIQQIQQSLQAVKAMPAYEGDAKLRDEIAAVLQAYLESFRIEFKQVNLLKQNSKASYDAMEQYLKASTDAEKKLDAASDRAAAAQLAFAKKYKIQIAEDEEKAAGAKLLNELNNYHRAIFLRVFKMSKKDAEFSDALQAQNAAQMERFRKELEVICDENLMFLERLPAFNGDAAYRDAAVAMTKFFKDNAGIGYKKLTEVIRKGNQRTQEDVDAFNKVIDRNNNESPRLNDAVNEAANQLFKKNVPKPIETRQI